MPHPPNGRKNRPFYTVLILPHARSRFRKLHVSRGFVMTFATLGVVLLLAGLYAPQMLFRIRAQQDTIASLEQNNTTLRDERDEVTYKLELLSLRLDDYESHAVRMADALGVEGLPSGQPASGGPSGAPGGNSPSLDREVGWLDDRAANLDRSMDQLDGAFAERMKALASTPNAMPVQGWFSHGFGWRKDPWTGGRQFHRGIDIVADSGTPVRAPADGVVSRTVRVADLGKSIDVSHGFGYVTRYAHLSEILVRPGQRVRRGDVIGSVGSTGRSTGPHLHYEVFREGRRVNPWKYLGTKG
ncbi:MAG: M23 family metallopeptidase [Planctomycetes bacterium]|nr:M23 family metallopeptidase [Planctomycetota bacterium]